MVTGKDKKQTAAHAKQLGEICRQLQQHSEEFSRSVEILGPIEAAVTKIAGRYRWQLLTKGSGVRSLHRFARALMAENQSLFQRHGIQVVVDVDPLFVM
jgi:primosomal protein N' (replication factor Y)